ncbi:unnamed protein product [Coccothraustes coccothraustes]
MPLCTEMQPAWKPVWRCVSENLQPCGTSVKEPERKREEEELPETQAAGERDRDLQSALLALLKKNEGEEEASAGDPWDEGHSKLFPTLEPEENSGFSASPLSGGPCEESATEYPALHKQQCMRPENLLHPMHKKREELEKVEEDKMYAEFFGDISSMNSEESPMMSSCDLRDPSIASLVPAADPLVPLRTCTVTKEPSGETQNYSELVSHELSADLGSDSEDSLSLETLLNELQKWEQEEEEGEWDTEVESPLSIPLREKELEPAPTLDSNLSNQGHSEPLPRALPQEPKGPHLKLRNAPQVSALQVNEGKPILSSHVNYNIASLDANNSIDWRKVLTLDE